MQKLAPLAAHIHLKPEVLGPLGQNARPKCIGIQEYGPVIRDILLQSEYHGAVSLEFTEFRLGPHDSIDEPRQLLSTIATILGQTLVQTNQYVVPEPKSPPLSVNTQREIVPSSKILELLAGGCEHRLNAPVHIHDFATATSIYSPGAVHRVASHRTTSVNPYCELVQTDSLASHACSEFHTQSLAQISNGLQRDSRLRLCPMGLLVLSVPIADATNLYGAITTGAWVEEGTEGMLYHSALLLTEADEPRRKIFDSASNRIEKYSITKMRGSQNLLQELSDDLRTLYKRRRDEVTYLTEATALINQVRMLSSQIRSVDEFIESLKNEFGRLLATIGYGTFGLYQLNEPRIKTQIRQYSCAFQKGDRVLPGALVFTLPKADQVAIDSDEGLAQMRRQLHDFVLPRSLSLQPVFVVFCAPAATQASGHLIYLLEQFAGEVEHIIASWLHLQMVEEKKRDLEVFIDRVKHTLNRPLQGLTDCVHQIRDLLSERSLEPSKGVEIASLVNEQLAFCQEAGHIIKRFAGRVQMGGQATLPSIPVYTCEYWASF